MNRSTVLENLAAPTPSGRLAALDRLLADSEATRRFPVEGNEVNNHVHTAYSFSPYSPTAAAWFAREAGLRAVGCMDHDSVSGTEEMLDAGKAIGIATTVGFEVRVNFSGTSVEGKRINNPDSINIVYVTVHGIPRNQLARADAFLAPIRELRNRRNRKEVEALNGLIAPYGLGPLDFESDVAGISMAAEGGGITERHILYALARRIVDIAGIGEPTVRFLEAKFGVSLGPGVRGFLEDPANPHYLYDLLGILKAEFLPRFFIQPDEEECIPVADVVSLANEMGAIPCYPYLGDVAESPTGDKKAQRFEDEFLDDLLAEIVRLGFVAVTYMPPRNTPPQLERIRRLCRENGLMEISGVDINSSRQSFNCPEILDPAMAHLIDSTWALIAHEKLAAAEPRYALFSPDNPLAGLPLEERIDRYAAWGRRMDRGNPEGIIDLVGP